MPKTKRRHRGLLFLTKLTPARGVIAIAAIAIIIAAVVLGIPFLKSALNRTTVITSSQLKDVVEISQLSTAEIQYSGIADIKNNDGSVEAHAFYEASIKMNVDMSAIDFKVNKETKQIEPILPDLNITEPVIDDQSIKYFERNPHIRIPDVISACKADAQNEVKGEGALLTTARDNLKSTVELLIKPLVEKSGYTIVWNENNWNVSLLKTS